MYRGSRAGRIYDGPDEVHIQNVALMLIGKFNAARQIAGLPSSKL